MHVPKSLFQGVEESTSCMGLPRQRVQFISVSSEALDIHTRLADMAQGLQEPCALPERQLKGRADMQATDSSPLSVTVSTSEHFPC